MLPDEMNGPYDETGSRLDLWVSRALATDPKFLDYYFSCFDPVLKFKTLNPLLTNIVNNPTADQYKKYNLTSEKIENAKLLLTTYLNNKPTKFIFESVTSGAISNQDSFDGATNLTTNSKSAAQRLYLQATDTRLLPRQWMLLNRFDVAAQGAASSYESQYGDEATSTPVQPVGMYQVLANPQLVKGNGDAKASLSGTHSGYVNQVPDNVKDVWSVNAYGDGKIRFKDDSEKSAHYITGSVSGNYSNTLYTPPEAEEQTAQFKEEKKADVGATYQKGGTGLTADVKYDDKTNISFYDSTHSDVLTGTAALKIRPTKQTEVMAGLLGERNASDSTLTGLSTVQGSVEGNGEFKTTNENPIRGVDEIVFDTSALAALVHSAGSLDGNYFYLKNVQGNLTLTKGASTFALIVGGNFYNWTLDYDDGTGATTPKQQNQVGLNATVKVDYKPVDFLTLDLAASWANTNQSGFAAVDSNTWSANPSVSLTTSKSSAKRRSVISLQGNLSRSTSQSNSAHSLTDDQSVELDFKVFDK